MSVGAMVDVWVRRRGIDMGEFLIDAMTPQLAGRSPRARFQTLAHLYATGEQFRTRGRGPESKRFLAASVALAASLGRRSAKWSTIETFSSEVWRSWKNFGAPELVASAAKQAAAAVPDLRATTLHHPAILSRFLTDHGLLPYLADAATMEVITGQQAHVEPVLTWDAEGAYWLLVCHVVAADIDAAIKHARHVNRFVDLMGASEFVAAVPVLAPGAPTTKTQKTSAT